MQTYNFDDYVLTLEETNKTDSHGHTLVKYTFSNPSAGLINIFEGEDFGASPLHGAESKDSAVALLGFLTCRIGDVEAEYFDNYTPLQLEFRDSSDCEMLQLFVYDYEN